MLIPKARGADKLIAMALTADLLHALIVAQALCEGWLYCLG